MTHTFGLNERLSLPKAILFGVVMLLSGVAVAQIPADTMPQAQRKPHIKPYGFVRNYFNYDSRNTYTVIGGEYNIAPYDNQWNATQEECETLGIPRTDLNAVPHAHFLAVSTRLGVDAVGPDIFGAASSARVEFDFGGFGTNNSLFRIRLAYMQLDWHNDQQLHQSLLAGQDWHPLSGNIMPDVLGMAAGAPFRAHSRTPQVRYTLYNGAFGFTAAALYQLQYMYNGPDANGNSVASTRFANNAIVPELFLGVNYRHNGVYAQLGSTCQPLRPRNFGSQSGYAVPVNELFFCFTPTVYFQYVHELFSLKFRSIYAQNTTHVNQLNGYAVTGMLPNGTWEYSPLRATISYLNLSYGKKYRINLFLGYQKNLGAARDLCQMPNGSYQIYMKGGDSFTHLNSMYRVAPSISYNLKHFNLGLEYEWTACTFGDLAANGSIKLNSNLHQVDNHRLCAMVKYNF